MKNKIENGTMVEFRQEGKILRGLWIDNILDTVTTRYGRLSHALIIVGKEFKVVSYERLILAENGPSRKGLNGEEIYD